MDNNTFFKPGYYKHFKGGIYHAIGIAKHSETLEPMVIYTHHYPACSTIDNPDIWVRPLSMWNEIVEIEGNKVPRFKFISYHNPEE